MITVVTRWEGTPKEIESIVEGSQNARPLHEELGALNPRLYRPMTGPGTFELALYAIDFPSMEAFGAFSDALRESGWWAQATERAGDAYPDVRVTDQTIWYDALD